jgi:hypothetical protein
MTMTDTKDSLADDGYVTRHLSVNERVIRAAVPGLACLAFALQALAEFLENKLTADVSMSLFLFSCGFGFFTWRLWSRHEIRELPYVRVPAGTDTTSLVEDIKSIVILAGLIIIPFFFAPWWAVVIIWLLILVVRK